MISDSNGVTNYSHKLFITDRYVSKFCQVFANNLSTNIKLSKNQPSKIVQSG